jgi:hypothetical protein
MKLRNLMNSLRPRNVIDTLKTFDWWGWFIIGFTLWSILMIVAYALALSAWSIVYVFALIIDLMALKLYIINNRTYKKL